jgi:plastocyanin
VKPRCHIGFSIALLVVACDRSPSADPAPAHAPIQANPVPAAPAATPPQRTGGGTITGKITFEGTPPAPPEMKRFSASGKPFEPTCATHEPAQYLMVTDGGVKDVLVRLAVGSVKDAARPPAEPAVMDQKNCLYVPHVLGIVAGQKVAYKNSDAILHNVHTLADGDPDFNDVSRAGTSILHDVALAPGDKDYHVQCDIHPWMEAHIVVTDHPYFTVSAADGSFTLANVPAGTYQLEAWHPHLGTRTVEITVAEGKTAEAKFASYKPTDYKAPE